MERDFSWKKNGFTMRSAKKEDAEAYYMQNFCPLDQDVVRLTGSKADFSREEVISFFFQSIQEDSRYFFLILAPDGRIIGESIINEIDWHLRCANFRIAIFHPSEWDQGIGSWATEATCDFAFQELKLHRLELEVYSFNPRAESVYTKSGFRKEGLRRDAILDGEAYADVIIMAMLEEDWKKRKAFVE